MFHWRDKNKKRRVDPSAGHHEDRDLPVPPPLPLQAAQLKGAGSSSKVVNKLGAPVTLMSPGSEEPELAIRRQSDGSASASPMPVASTSSQPRKALQQSSVSHGSTKAAAANGSSSSSGASHHNKKDSFSRSTRDSPSRWPNSRQSSAMSTDSLLQSPSQPSSSASSVNGNDTPPNSAPPDQVSFPAASRENVPPLELKPSLSRTMGSTKSSASSSLRSHTKAKQHNAPVGSRHDEESVSSHEAPTLYAVHSRSSSNAPRPIEHSADDATEEIVPWMYEVPPSSQHHSDTPFPQTDRSREPPEPSWRPSTAKLKTSISSNRAPFTPTSSVFSAAARDRDDDDVESIHDPSAAPRHKKGSMTSSTKGLFTRLRKKSSRNELFHNDDGLAPDPSRLQSPSMTSLSSSFIRPSAKKLTSRERAIKNAATSRKGSADGEGTRTPGGMSAQEAAASATGFTLDTNLDHMEGIVSQDALMSSTSGTGSFLNDAASVKTYNQRPSTPDSFAAAAAARRRGSLVPSIVGGAPSEKPESGHDSPMGSSTRRNSLNQQHDGWRPALNFTRADNEPQSSSSSLRQTSEAASLNGRRPSIPEEGRVTPVPSTSHKPFGGTPNRSASSLATDQQRPPTRQAQTQVSQAIDLSKHTEASWTAPESWAVEEMAQNREEADASDEEGQVASAPLSNGLQPASPLVPVTEPRSWESSAGKRLSVTGLAGRPGTAGSVGGTSNVKPTNFAIRIFKPDNTFTTLSVPMNTPSAEIVSMVSRKPGFISGSGRHMLFLREKGTERIMVSNEKPVRFQQLRFEQAGYSEWDKPEDLGREDHSYMIKFIFKPDAALRLGSEDFRPDTFEYIDLRDRGVANIPIFLYNHAHDIVSLNLSRNPKPDLPSDFVQLCSSLRELRLAETGMKRVPQSIRQAAGLTRLDISSNRIVELDHIALNEETELMLIESLNNRISSLPPYFAHFKALKYLDFSNNKFEEFPTVLCSIGSLTDLDLSFNSLKSLPETLGRMTSLERLILTANSITSLPASMDHMIRLFELDVRYNQIEDISALSHLPKLTTLRACHNRITSFEMETDCLRDVSLAHNPANSFFITGTARYLTKVDLSRCRITDSSRLEDLMSECVSVTDINLDYNSIRRIPSTIVNMSNLARLSIVNNKLESLPENIGDVGRLQHLIVPNNDLHTIPASIWNLSELLTLNLSSNLVTEFPDPPPIRLHSSSGDLEADRKMSSASKLSNNTKFSATVPGASPLAACLQSLIMTDNRLSDETFHPVSLMTELRVLNLSYNEIFEIPPKTLPKNNQLEELYLSGCKLTTLPEDDIERLVNLRILHLNGNKLNTLPAELGVLKKLTALDVGSNVLKYNIANWKYDWNWNWNLELRYLNLSGNKRLEIKQAGSHAMQGGADEGGFAAAKRRNLSDFTALRKLRTLGLMDVTLTIPNVPDDTEARRVRTSLSEVNNMGYGVADTLGSQDALSLVDLVVPKFRNSDEESIFGFFDTQVSASQTPFGTSGQTDARLARYLQDCFSTTLHLELTKMVPGESGVPDVLRRTFLGINRDYGNIIVPAYMETKSRGDSGDRYASSLRSGASGIVAYVSGKKLYVANVGRSLGVMAGRSGLAKLLTTSHDPLNREEWLRVRNAEGFVSSRGYVNDDLDVTRSFGHFHTFPAVNASPTVHSVELSDQDELVILANRNFWDFVDFQSAVDIARAERADTMMAAQKLRDLAIAYGCKGHLMVMVISVADIFKAKLAPKRRGLAADAEGDDSYALAKAAASRARTANGIMPGERYLSLMDREIAPPTGFVALVFTDIRNSTALWETNQGMQVAIRMHNQLLRRQLRAIGGYEVKTEGDAFMCSFPSVTSALLWAFTVQLELLHQDWPQSILDCEDGVELYDGIGEHHQLIYRGLCVRMGIHWGEPHCESDPITRRMDYFGPMVNRSARVESVAEGGQITASADVVEIVKELCGFHSDDPSHSASLTQEEFDEMDEVTKRDINAIRSMGVCITELGEKRLKGLETSESISLLYPKALAGRLKYSSTTHATGQQISGATQTLEPIPHLLDVIQIQAIGTLILRAEAAAAARTNPMPSSTLLVSGPLVPKGPPPVGRNKRKQSYHPHMSEYPIALDATDEELLAVLEGLVIRIENLTSSLMLHQLGPYTEVLGALSDASKVEPGMILQALSMFAGLMGQNVQGLPPQP